MWIGAAGFCRAARGRRRESWQPFGADLPVRCGSRAVVIGAGLLSLASPAASDPNEVARTLLEACLAQEGRLSACAGEAENVCLFDEAQFAHAPDTLLRREWCLRAETAAFQALAPDAIPDPGTCPMPDIGAMASAHLQEALCLRDAVVAAIKEDEP